MEEFNPGPSPIPPAPPKPDAEYQEPDNHNTQFHKALIDALISIKDQLQLISLESTHCARCCGDEEDDSKE